QTGTNTSPVQIQNNVIGNIKGTNLVTVATNNPANYGMGIMGINLTSALTSGVYSITNNTIGSASVPNSIYSMNPSISSAAQYVYGIRSTSSGTVTINNNIVANLTNAAVGNVTNTSLGSLSHQTGGIYVTSGINTINNNTVFNLSCASTQAGLGGAATVVGIMQSPNSTVHTTAPQIVNGNTVHSLFSTATSGTPSVVGIFNWSPNAGNNSVSKNTVHSLSVVSNNPTSTIYGIHMNAGIATVANNAIRLGIDAAGNPLTVGYNIVGMLKQPLTIAGGITTQVPNNMDFLHNSVYIGGSNVAENGIGQGSSTFAFQKNMPGNDILLNNIFINTRSNSTGVGKHYSAGADATAGLISDYNLMQAIGTGGVLFGTGIPTINTDYTTLSAWRQATLLDVNSATGVAANIANFINPTGTAGTVNMHVQSATPAEASGVDVITALQGTGRPYVWDGQDVDGSNRSALTPNDIGADAGNFTAADIFPPAISYAPFTNSSATTTRTVTGIAITDASGVNVTSGTRPRLYYKRNQDANTIADNTSATNGWKWVEASNTTSPFSFTIDYSKVNGGSISTGDNIQYFITAQDLATTPNVAINSGIFTTTPSNVNLSAANTPINGTINNYAIIASVSGTINVGTGQTYSSLTRQGGLFQMLNNVGMISGNVVVNVTSDLAEDGTYPLNQLTEEGTGGYTIKIQPADNNERSISGSYIGGLIRLNGADRVIFDGRFNGSGTLLNISNTATTNFNGSTTFGIAAIQIISQGVNAGCVADTIRNCKISTGSNQTFSYGIYGGSLVVPNSISGTGADNDNIAIMNNIITNAQIGVYMRGVAPSNLLTGLSINNNQFGTSNNSTTITTRAVDIESCDGALISGNDIININSQFTTNTSGIEIGQWTTNSRIVGNSICGVSNLIQVGVLTCGVRVNTTTGTSGITIANNFINGVTAYGVNTVTGSNPYGIRIDGGINFNIVHNTIVMDGSFSNTGVSSSAALQMTSTSSAGFIVRNNILVNTMSGGAGTKCYAVYVPNTTLPFTMGTFNNNDYYVGSSNYAGFFLSDLQTTNQWQTATGQDAATVSVNPTFAGANCRSLYLGITNPQLVGSSAVSSIVNTDIDGLPRTTYYMGADEVTPTFQFTSTPQSQSICINGNVTMDGTATVTFNDGISRTQMDPTYRWTKNSTTISGATSNTFSITNATSTDAGIYNVIAKFGQYDSLVSSNAVISIGTPVSIITQPTAPSSLCAGSGGFTLTVTAGGKVLGYLWKKYPQRNGTWTNISVATIYSYAVWSVAAAVSGKYRCIIT
ncbi:MAG: hypothetical protein JNJ85_15720, partial [Candidatus Kapabacteria bacterium]|nr:hypothetical protein [Candidatus Kapabacteria bacterium]